MSATLKNAPAGVADRVMNEQREIFLAAEEILFKLGSIDELNSVQRAVLRRAGIEDRLDIEREMGRIASAKRFMAAAGTAQDLHEAEKQMIATAREERERLPALKAQFEDIESQIKALETARLAAQKRHEQLTDAREQLRKLAPKFVRESRDFDVSAATFPYRARIAEVESALAVLSALEKVPAGSQSAELHAESSAPHLLAGRRLGQRGIDATAWNGYVRARQKERPKLEEELRELQTKRQRAVNELGDGLAWYINKLG